jgi:hypothetical protein
VSEKSLKIAGIALNCRDRSGIGSENPCRGRHLRSTQPIEAVETSKITVGWRIIFEHYPIKK